MKPAKSVRTRFAPSPTGFLHVGNVRAALYPWLVARQAGGTFILRIEDTDQAREVAGAVQVIRETLSWLGMDWDEGPDKPGQYGPYIQSERMQTGSYEHWVHILLQSGRAYVDPYTREEVEAFREQAKAEKRPFLFRNHRPENPSTQWDKGMTLRFKSEPKDYDWHDAVMGDLHANSEAMDDFILIKADGFPTYNFAHIIDDHEMQVSHVIRGLEYISSMPNYLNLYEALGFELPIFAHAPHIMNEQGNKKLSKRDGAKGVLDYRDEGFLPAAVFNFLASLGWNDGTEQELFSREEIITKFSLDRVQRSGARFDEQRLLWMNGAHIRELSLDDLYAKVADFWPAEATDYDDTYKKRVLGLIQERLKYFAEIPSLTEFFFKDLPVNPELWTAHKQLKKVEAAEIKSLLEQAKASLEQSDFSVDDLTAKLNALLEQTNQKPAVLFSLIRIATTQAPFSPGLAETLNVLGKDVSLRRLNAMLAAL